METLFSVTLFAGIGILFVFGGLTAGRLLRPSAPNAIKSATYECGEPTIGPSRVQFDLRFYIVALLFLVFDVEVALLYPWAVLYGDAAAVAARLGTTVFHLRATALVDLLVFFGLLLLGFAHLWRSGSLDWTPVRRASSPTSGPLPDEPPLL